MKVWLIYWLLVIGTIFKDIDGSENEPSRNTSENAETIIGIIEESMKYKLDNEVQRQMTNIEARIDNRVPALLGYTIEEKIKSGEIAEANNVILIARVDRLEKQLALLMENMEGNVTEMESRLLDVEQQLGNDSSREDARFISDEVRRNSKVIDDVRRDLLASNTTINNMASDLSKVSLQVGNVTSNLEVVKNVAADIDSLQRKTQQTDIIVNAMSAQTKRDLSRLSNDIYGNQMLVNASMVRIDEVENGLISVESFINETSSMMKNYSENHEALGGLVQSWTQATIDTSYWLHDLKTVVDNHALLLDNNELEKLRTKLSETESSYNRTAETVREIQAQVGNLDVNSNRTDYRISYLQSSFTSLVQNITGLNEALIETKADNQKLRSDMDDLNRNEAVTDVVNTLDSKLNATVARVGRNSENVRSLSLSIQNARATASANLNKIIAMTSNVSSLETNVDSLKTGGGTPRNIQYQVRLSTRNTRVMKSMVVKFDKAMVANGGGYSVRTGIFTAPVAGTYLFWGHFVLNEKSKTLEIDLKKNNVKIAATAGITSSNVRFNTLLLTTLTDLEKGDTIKLQVSHGTASTIFGFMYSGYGGMLVGAK